MMHSTAFQCEFCDHRSARIQSLQKHIQSVHGEAKLDEARLSNSLVWNETNELNAPKSEDIQISTYTGNKKTCPICGITFRIDRGVGYLRRHIEAVHEGKKRFQCDICKKQFAEKTNLNRHVSSVHEGKKRKKQSYKYPC